MAIDINAILCDVVGCEEDAIASDDMGNYYCGDCLEREMEESDTDPEDYESI